MKINAYYRVNQKKIKKSLQKEGIVCLTNFLEEESYQELKKHIKSLKYKSHYMPESYNFSSSPLTVTSKELRRFIKEVTGKENLSLESLKLVRGNYALLQTSLKETHPIELIVDLNDNWNTTWGGSIVYTNGQGDYYKIQSVKNSLILVKKDKLHRFLSYVNHYAQSPRWIILARLR